MTQGCSAAGSGGESVGWCHSAALLRPRSKRAGMRPSFAARVEHGEFGHGLPPIAAAASFATSNALSRNDA